MCCYLIHHSALLAINQIFLNAWFRGDFKENIKDGAYFALPRIRGYRVHDWLQTKSVIALVTCITDQHLGVFPWLPKWKTFWKISKSVKMLPKCKTTTSVFYGRMAGLFLKCTCRFGTPYSLGTASQSAGVVWRWSQDRHHGSVAHSLCSTATLEALVQSSSHIPHSVPPLQLNRGKGERGKGKKKNPKTHPTHTIAI